MLDGEKKIIKNAIKGEAPAFGLLYDHYQPMIYRFICLKVSHREEAEDLTHQVFLQTWRKISEYDFQGFPFSTWLYRIARNEVIDYYRTKKTHLAIEDVIETDLPELGTDDATIQLLDQNLNMQAVRSAIEKLRPIEQDVIILRFVEDFSPSEVAIFIDKTPEAVRLIQHRAIKNLQRIIASIK